MKFLLVFTILSIVNVVFSTVRTLATVKGGKVTASLLSGGYFAYYNIVVIWTVAEFPMWQKCIITFVANVIGVYAVKWNEERRRKDKLWKIEATVNSNVTVDMIADLKTAKLSYNYLQNIGQFTLFNIYSGNQAESIKAKEILIKHNAKFFVSESKLL